MAVLLQKFDVASFSTTSSTADVDPDGATPAAAPTATPVAVVDNTRASVLQFLFGPAAHVDGVERRGLLSSVFTALQFGGPSTEAHVGHAAPCTGSDNDGLQATIWTAQYLVTRAETLFADTDMVTLVCAEAVEFYSKGQSAAPAAANNNAARAGGQKRNGATGATAAGTASSNGSLRVKHLVLGVGCSYCPGGCGRCDGRLSTVVL